MYLVVITIRRKFKKKNFLRSDVFKIQKHKEEHFDSMHL